MKVMVDGLVPSADTPTAILDLLAFDAWPASLAIQQVAQGVLLDRARFGDGPEGLSPLSPFCVLEAEGLHAGVWPTLAARPCYVET